AGAGPEKVIAFDTGPGNMVIDAAMERLFGKRFDRGGRVAASGTVDDGAIAKLMRLCGRTNKANVAATATAFTVRSIADAVQRFVLRRARFAEMVVSGGGAKNPTLMGMLANELSTLGVALRTSDEFGIPAEAKEAVAFALMAYETWHQRPSNVPSATGAKRSAVLG